MERDVWGSVIDVDMWQTKQGFGILSHGPFLTQVDMGQRGTIGVCTCLTL